MKMILLLDFLVEPEENVFPMVPPGESLAKTLEVPKGLASLNG